MKRTIKWTALILLALALLAALWKADSWAERIAAVKQRVEAALWPRQNVWTEAPVLESIRQMQVLSCASYYEELPIVSSKSHTWPIPDDELVIIYRVTVEAGFDLSRLREEDVTQYGDSAITLHLPDPEILSVRCNPSDKTVFHDNNAWSDAELKQLHRQATDRAERNALQEGLLRRASENGRAYLTRLLSSCGYRHVEVVQDLHLEVGDGD